MKLLVYPERKYNVVLILMTVAFILSFVLPWETVVEETKIAGDQTETRTIQLGIFSILEKHEIVSDTETVELSNESSSTLIDFVYSFIFILIFGILLVLLLIFCILIFTTLFHTNRMEVILLRVVSIVAFIVFLAGFSIVLNMNPFFVPEGQSVSYVRFIFGSEHGTKLSLAGTCFLQEVSFTRWWAPNIGFLCFTVAIFCILYLTSKRAIDLLDRRIIQVFSLKKMLRPFSSSQTHRYLTIGLMICLLSVVSILTPWFTVSKNELRFNEGIVTETSHYYLTAPLVENENEKSKFPYNDPNFANAEAGGSFLVNLLNKNTPLLLIGIILSCAFLAVVVIKKRSLNLVLIAAILIATVLCLTFLLCNFTVNAVNALRLDIEYCSALAHDRPGGNPYDITVDTFWGSDGEIHWGPGIGYYTCIAAALLTGYCFIRTAYWMLKRPAAPEPRPVADHPIKGTMD